jgi:hypothetical protein
MARKRTEPITVGVNIVPDDNPEPSAAYRALWRRLLAPIHEPGADRGQTTNPDSLEDHHGDPPAEEHLSA